MASKTVRMFNNVSSLLKQIKLEAHESVTSAAIATRVGVSSDNYTKWERGQSSIPPNKVQAVAKALAQLTDPDDYHLIRDRIIEAILKDKKDFLEQEFHYWDRECSSSRSVNA